MTTKKSPGRPKGTRKPPPVRFRLAVPVADQPVIDWLNMQDNVSGSLRLVIREYIERHGFVDATCAPVEKLPRRGRPPKDEREHPGADAAQGYDERCEDDELDDEVDLDRYADDGEGEGEDSSAMLGHLIAQSSGRAAEGHLQQAQAERGLASQEEAPEPQDMSDIFSAGRNR